MEISEKGNKILEVLDQLYIQEANIKKEAEATSYQLLADALEVRYVKYVYIYNLVVYGIC